MLSLTQAGKRFAMNQPLFPVVFVPHGTSREGDRRDRCVKTTLSGSHSWQVLGAGPGFVPLYIRLLLEAEKGEKGPIGLKTFYLQAPRTTLH